MSSAFWSIAPGEARVDPSVASHEARHAAAALMLGLEVKEARADNPSPEMGGYVALGRLLGPASPRRRCDDAAGPVGRPGWPPESPSEAGADCATNESWRTTLRELGLGRRGYELMVADAEHLVDDPEFKSLADMIEEFLAQGCVLAQGPARRGPQGVRQDESCNTRRSRPRPTSASEVGEFSAIAAAYSIDRDGDQIVRDAVRHTIERWQAVRQADPVALESQRGPEGHRRVDRPRLNAGGSTRGYSCAARSTCDGSDSRSGCWRADQRTARVAALRLPRTDKATASRRRARNCANSTCSRSASPPAPANPDTCILETKSVGGG